MGPRGDYALAIAESLFMACGTGSYNSNDLTNPTALHDIGASCNNPLLQYILQYKTYLQIKSLIFSKRIIYYFHRKWILKKTSPFLNQSHSVAIPVIQASHSLWVLIFRLCPNLMDYLGVTSLLFGFSYPAVHSQAFISADTTTLFFLLPTNETCSPHSSLQAAPKIVSIAPNFQKELIFSLLLFLLQIQYFCIHRSRI